MHLSVSHSVTVLWGVFSMIATASHRLYRDLETLGECFRYDFHNGFISSWQTLSGLPAGCCAMQVISIPQLASTRLT